MKLSVNDAWEKALKKRIDIRIGNDDPTISYQEFFLYWVLRLEFSNSKEFIDTDTLYDFYKNKWPDEQWKKSEASKYNKIEISKPWDKVFD